MKNILLMVPRLNMGGAETYTYNLALLLKKQGYTVVVASGGGSLARSLRRAGITTCFLPQRLSTALASYWLSLIIKFYKIDLIHANSAAAGITAVKYKLRGNNIPIVYTAHGVITDKEATYLQHCDEIIAVSNFLKNEITKNPLFDPKKITTIYTGINTSLFDPEKVAAVSRESLNIPPKAFTIVQVARVRNLINKGHQIMLNIMTHYDFAKDWHLIVVGDGSQFYKLKQQVDKMGLKQRVHLVGQQLNVPAYIKTADVVVSASRFETFGLALAEAMAMAKPAVAFKVGGVGEIVKEQATGYLIKYPEENAFAQALNLLSQDINKTKAMGLAARLDISQRFPIKHMMQAILTIYERNLNNGQ